MSGYSERKNHHWAAALNAIGRLESKYARRSGHVAVSETADCCGRIERAVGREGAVGEKLASILRQAETIEQLNGDPGEDGARARLIVLADCASLRTIIDRLTVQ